MNRTNRRQLLFVAAIFISATTGFCEYAAAQLVSSDADVIAARHILDAWHADNPEPGTRSLHLVCWTPSDRDFPADYEARLTRIMLHIQEFYLREMERLGFGSRTIRLPLNSDGRLVLHTVVGKQPTAHYSKSSGSEIRSECLPKLREAGIEADSETIMILCNLATWDAEKLTFKHESPYYAGGSYRSGTAWQLDSPELDSLNLILAEPIIRDGEYGRISLGKHNSIFIGGIAHELGHAIGLPHCKARPDEAVRGTALMGSGNRTYGDELRGDGRGSFLTLAHALRLASHPQFSGSVKGLNQRATVTMNDVIIESDGKALKVSGIVEGNPPVYAVVAYFDPEGGGDYNCTTASAVPDKQGRFEVRCDALPNGKNGELRLFPLHCNGSAAKQMSRTPFRYPYSIRADGTPDLTAIQTRQSLVPLVTLLNANKTQAAEKLAANITIPEASAVAQRLIHPVVPTQTPAEATSMTATPLTNFKPSKMKVGWASPVFDRVPEAARMLESGGQIFATGIYAHAPAEHSYELNKRWKALKGKSGLASGHPGTVRFEIVGDGQSHWTSKTLRVGQTAAFEVDVSRISQLTLLTHTTDDGASGDWGLWLEPTLIPLSSSR